ncbi:hypothetical protein GGI35DRAFT_489670 [Trichoderma velutinum]
MDHRACQNNLCAADHVDDATYVTVHTEEGCKCKWVQANSEKICAMLENGKIPRIVISKDMELVVTDSQPYVAISHVWAHGRGNPSGNALPQCQIERLSMYLSKMRIEGHQNKALAIWMDTLCIPVHPGLKPYRKKAIKQMGSTYQHATAVLVLEREIECLDMNSVSLLERDLVAAFVAWTRRLWTLQEAALAPQLYIQTQTSSIKLDNTLREEEEACLVAQICFRKDIVRLTRMRIPSMNTLKKSVLEQTSTPSTSILPFFVTTTAFQKLAHAVKHRATSKMEDEALILAITLGFETDTILAAPNVDLCMAALLVMLKDVPADIRFGNWSKLAHAPFRWAPRTLLGFPLQAMRSFGPSATCDIHGLHATYEGLVINGWHSKSGRGDIFAIDKMSQMKYKFQLPSDNDVAIFPDSCALIFRANGIEGGVAIARILGTSKNSSGKSIIEAVVTGYLIQVENGQGLGVTGQNVLEGTLTLKDQDWCIT